MKNLWFLLFVVLFFLIINPILAEGLPYQEIQQAIKKKDHLSALKLARQLPEEEKLYLSGILEEKLGRYKEAIDLIELGTAFPIGSSPEFEAVFKDLAGDEMRKLELKSNLAKYIADNKGASEKIIAHLKEYML